MTFPNMHIHFILSEKSTRKSSCGKPHKAYCPLRNLSRDGTQSWPGGPQSWPGDIQFWPGGPQSWPGGIQSWLRIGYPSPSGTGTGVSPPERTWDQRPVKEPGTGVLPSPWWTDWKHYLPHLSDADSTNNKKVFLHDYKRHTDHSVALSREEG